MALPGSYNLKWHGHGMHLNTSISGLYRSDAFTDVVLATTDGRYFSAHQFVLSACSQYLNKIFTFGNNSSKTGAKIIVVLPSEISHSTFSIVLQYIYKGEVIVNHEQLPGIMKAAELLQVRGLCLAKDKHDTRSSSSNVLKQQNKNNSESKTVTETLKVSQRLLIPEVRYNAESVDQSPTKANEIINKPSPTSSSPVRKKQKNNLDESVLGLAKDSDMTAIVEDDSIIVGEEVQVKEEPVDWQDQNVSEDIHTYIKQEVITEELIIQEENCFVPLTCDLCQETFATPALWVRHIEKQHPSTALAYSKRGTINDGTEYPPLHCELCQQVFSVPSEWVKHVHSHHEQEISKTTSTANNQSQNGRGRVECTICGKVLQSQASMQIHARTHTGERPYLCKVCGREFNVKSNFLRHLRTLHDHTVATSPE